jgi:putative acetyltransferase
MVDPTQELLRVELARPEDAESILHVHFAAVHQTAASFYTEEIACVWSPPVNAERVEPMRRVLEQQDELVAVAHLDGEIVGFGSIVPAALELRAVYVHPAWGRRGVGTSLLQALEQIALERGMTYLQMEASLNAESFYRRNGFDVIARGTHRLSTGQEMPCVKMQKSLGTPRNAGMEK